MMYVFECLECQIRFEVDQKITDVEHKADCPICGKPASRRFTSVGAIFRGTGFHTTDYK